jgi:hypothetical protein
MTIVDILRQAAGNTLAPGRFDAKDRTRRGDDGLRQNQTPGSQRGVKPTAGAPTQQGGGSGLEQRACSIAGTGGSDPAELHEPIAERGAPTELDWLF